MEKIIKIGDRDIPVRSTAASLIRYKANFQHDGIGDLFSLANGMPNGEGEVAKDFDFEVFWRFLWVFAKSADKSIPPLEEWLDGFDMPPFDFVSQVLPQVSDMLATTAKSAVKPKKK